MKKLAPLAAAVMVVASVGTAAADGWGFKVYGMIAMVSPLSESEQDVGGVVDAVKAYVSLGEISDVYRQVFGLYREPIIF